VGGHSPFASPPDVISGAVQSPSVQPPAAESGRSGAAMNVSSVAVVAANVVSRLVTLLPSTFGTGVVRGGGRGMRLPTPAVSSKGTSGRGMGREPEGYAQPCRQTIQ
jgi:hypothetical protein